MCFELLGLGRGMRNRFWFYGQAFTTLVMLFLSVSSERANGITVFGK